ncbi:hypothetical protein QYE76_068028 [Lolium multiflorum]|uniref:Uncharacterized protein n=1 Tax=Lolium multiflorum TaxID=4521 RepID=A0AAD8WBJ3_LOLMU|nr:hypothetical protein QYE76_068028 [Lolium multiflorum]
MENYPLLMGDSSGDKDGGGVDGGAFEHFPARRLVRDSVPDLGPRWRRLLEGFCLSGFSVSRSKKTDPTIPPAAAASEASAPKAAPTAQASTASSLSKGKDAPAATTTPPSDLRSVISSLEAFASQFISLEVDKVRLQKEVESSSSKLEGAVKIAAKARQEIDSLKEELGKLKEKLKEEEASRLAAEAQAAERDELLCQSSLALLEAANIPAAALDKVPNNSPANGVSMALASHQLTWELLEKVPGGCTDDFPKIKRDKTSGSR